MKRVPNAFLPLRKIYDAKKFSSKRGNDNEKKLMTDKLLKERSTKVLKM